MPKLPSALTATGLLLILVGGLQREDMTSGGVAFMAFLILGVATYPPADPPRGHQAALILAGTIGVLALGWLFEEVRAGPVLPQAIEELLLLTGAGLVGGDAAGRLRRHREVHGATAWTDEPGRAPGGPSGRMSPS